MKTNNLTGKRFHASFILAIAMMMFSQSASAKLDYTPLRGGSSYDGCGFERLFDDNVLTKWCAADTHEGYDNGWWVIFKTSKAICPTSYTIVTGDDTKNNYERNWKTWKIYGANFDSSAAAIGTDDDLHANFDVLFQLSQVVVAKTDAAFAGQRADRVGIMRAVDADPRMRRRLQADEPRAIGVFDHALAVAEVVRPRAGVLDLLYGEHAFRRAHVALFLLVAGDLAGRASPLADDLVAIDEIKVQLGLVDEDPFALFRAVRDDPRNRRVAARRGGGLGAV